MKENYDVIIVGTGAAGLYCALNLPSRMKVLMLTKQQADQSDSFLAQGGICMLRGEEDYNDFYNNVLKNPRKFSPNAEKRITEYLSDLD